MHSGDPDPVAPTPASLQAPWAAVCMRAPEQRGLDFPPGVPGCPATGRGSGRWGGGVLKSPQHFRLLWDGGVSPCHVHQVRFAVVLLWGGGVRPQPQDGGLVAPLHLHRGKIHKAPVPLTLRADGDPLILGVP